MQSQVATHVRWPPINTRGKAVLCRSQPHTYSLAGSTAASRKLCCGLWGAMLQPEGSNCGELY